jgi:hypothetical protein
MTKRRVRVPAAVEASVLVKSARRCALCFGVSGDLTEKHGQIAHLDGDPGNCKRGQPSVSLYGAP